MKKIVTMLVAAMVTLSFSMVAVASSHKKEEAAPAAAPAAEKTESKDAKKDKKRLQRKKPNRLTKEGEERGCPAASRSMTGIREAC